MLLYKTFFLFNKRLNSLNKQSKKLFSKKKIFLANFLSKSGKYQFKEYVDKIANLLRCLMPVLGQFCK